MCLQYGFLLVAAVILLVRAFSFMDKLRGVRAFSKEFQDISLECNKLLLDIRRERGQSHPLQRYKLMKDAETMVKDVQEHLGPDAKPKQLTFYKLATFVDVLLDTFNVFSILIVAAWLLDAFALNQDMVRIGYGVNLLVNLMFPYILERARVRCKAYAFAMTMRLSFARDYKSGYVPGVGNIVDEEE